MRHRRTAWLLAPLLGVVLTACSEVSGPEAVVDDAAIVVGTLPGETGTQEILIASDASTQYCEDAPAVFNPTLASFGALNCVAASDLTAALQIYNPGWPLPTGAAWIGAQADANEYTVTPGSYLFQETFTLPAGATEQQINLTLRADNAAFVYLNGVLIGSHDPVQDNPLTWTTDLLITHSANFAENNTLSVILVNTTNGYNYAGPGTNRCALGPQSHGWAGAPVGTATVPTPQSLAGGWSVADCENPSAVWFTARVGYTPPPPPGTEGCTPGFWKNHPAAWAATGYSSGATVKSVFSSAFGTDANVTLLAALDFGGGPGAAGAQRNLLRAAVAALLNAANADVDYPMTTAEIIAAVNTAIASNNRATMLALASDLDAKNNLGCPINGK